MTSGMHTQREGSVCTWSHSNITYEAAQLRETGITGPSSCPPVATTFHSTALCVIDAISDASGSAGNVLA